MGATQGRKRGQDEERALENNPGDCDNIASAERKEVTLPNGLLLTALKQSFALRPSDGKVCPKWVIQNHAVEPPDWGWKPDLL